MDLIKLKYLCKTAETGSIRKASEAFNVSPGAISKALKLLDANFGTKIFAHSAKGSSLTDDGIPLYKQSKKLIDDYEAMRISYCKKTRMELRIGTYCAFTTFVLEDILENHLSSLSFLQLSFPPEEIEKAILDNRVDLGLTFLPFPQKGIDIITLGTIKMGIFTKRGAFSNVNFENIPFVTCVTKINGSNYNIQNIDSWPCETFRRDIKYKVFGLDTALGIARRGLGAIYCPNYIAKLHNKTVLENFQLVSIPFAHILQPQELTISLLKRSSMKENLAIRRIALYFRTLCRDEAIAII